jgi:hypothetical protein
MLESDGIYLQRYDDEYFTCQKVVAGSLVMAGILTVAQLQSKYPGEQLIHSEPPKSEKYQFKPSS